MQKGITVKTVIDINSNRILSLHPAVERFFEMDDTVVQDAFFSDDPLYVKQVLSEFESVYDKAAAHLDPESRDYYAGDVAGLREHLDELEKKE